MGEYWPLSDNVQCDNVKELRVMHHTFGLKTRGIDRVDLHMLLSIVMLTIFGLVMILSASGYICATSKIYDYNMCYLVENQLVCSIAGILLMLVIARIDYHFWEKFALLAYFIAIGLILMLKLPESFVIHGITRDEATRWLAVGPVSFQVADVVKLALVVFFAWFCYRFGKMFEKGGGYFFSGE